MEGKKFKKQRKKEKVMGQQYGKAAAPQPLYHKGVRTDTVDAGMERPKGKPPMDPRYPPAKYVHSEDYAYGGPTVVLPANAPLIVQPHLEVKKNNRFGKFFIFWLILGLVLAAISITIVFVAMYVMGEFTEASPVFKGYFG